MNTAHASAVSKRNWPLLIGAIIVALVVVVAVAGPWLAPLDPMARTPVVKIGERWVGPPYPALSPGFPLGSDRAGRDLFSRLLWAVRPTLAMVAIIAIVRLVIGMAMGLIAGFGRGAASRMADSATRVALAVPVLVVALATIAFVGIQRGLIAFILGLALTGWAETARYVETQTRIVKGQPFMEAAAGMGAPANHLVLYHVLRHILPLAAMLLALEVSGTLMTTAALGFLGYYIGGGAWLTVEDFVARSTTGLPELGQMLATALEQLLNPWPMLVVGGFVVLIILGFSLLGEGLRRQLEGEVGGRLPLVDSLLERLAAWLAGGFQLPAPARRNLAMGAAAAAVALVVVGAWALQRAGAGSGANAFSLSPPGGQLWATERHDPFGTLTITGTAPISPTVLWSFAAPSGITGAPAVAADGTVYVAAADGTITAIQPDGTVVQQWAVPDTPIGAPAIGPDGTVYVVDVGPGLSALAPDGTTRWRFAFEGRRPTSGPVVGPDGTIYFTRVDLIQAVAPDGQPRWLSYQVPETVEQPPRFGPDGDLLLLGPNAFVAADGTRSPLTFPVRDEMQFMQPRLATGADGQLYLLAGNNAVQWRVNGGQAEAANVITWDLGGFNIILPSELGIATDGNFWIFYGYDFTDTRLVWLDPGSRVLANMEVPMRGSRLLGIDGTQRAFLCSAQSVPTCMILDQATGGATWEMTLPEGRNVVGGALLPGRLYITTGDGWLHALGD